MESLTTAKLTTTRDLTYTYVKTAPTQEGKPWILFLHGFPSSVFHYRHQISHFTKAGYGIIAPTLLGYGNTSKPTDYNVYSGKGMSQDIKEILTYEKIDSVIGVGHDWCVLCLHDAITKLIKTGELTSCQEWQTTTHRYSRNSCFSILDIQIQTSISTGKPSISSILWFSRTWDTPSLGTSCSLMRRMLQS